MGAFSLRSVQICSWVIVYLVSFVPAGWPCKDAGDCDLGSIFSGSFCV